MKKYFKLLKVLMILYSNNGSRYYPQTYISQMTEMFEIFFKRQFSFEVGLTAFLLIQRFYQEIRNVKNSISFTQEEAIYRYFAIKGKINKLRIDNYTNQIIEKPHWLEIIQKKINEFVEGKIIDEEEFYYYLVEAQNKLEMPLIFVDTKLLINEMKSQITETRIKIIYTIFKIIQISSI